MKIIFISLISILAMTFAVSAKTPQTITLGISQTKTADHGKLKVTFLSVVEDSRCPINARCVWAGNAKIKLRVSNGRSAAQTIEINSTIDPTSVSICGYEIKFIGLTPHPGETKGSKALNATISISKA